MSEPDRSRGWDLAYQGAHRDHLSRLLSRGIPWRKANLEAWRHAERVVLRAIHEDTRAQQRGR